MEDAYSVLGVDPEASQKEIKDAYRQLIDLVHPDKAGTDPKKVARATRLRSRGDDVL